MGAMIFLRALWLTFPDQLNGGSFAGGYLANVHIASSYCSASRIVAVEAARTIVINGMGILGLAHDGRYERHGNTRASTRRKSLLSEAFDQALNTGIKHNIRRVEGAHCLTNLKLGRVLPTACT
jgi:hypothetical protein